MIMWWEYLNCPRLQLKDSKDKEKNSPRSFATLEDDKGCRCYGNGVRMTRLEWAFVPTIAVITLWTT
jgi:hypothetical protein